MRRDDRGRRISCGRSHGSSKKSARGRLAHAQGRRRHSARLFEDILADEEHHIDYLQAQLVLLTSLGEALHAGSWLTSPTRVETATGHN